ncbi:MAG: 4-alpha-glucanotransferase, partial [Paludibacter sp.]
MKIYFKLPYYTYWGQKLMVSGNIPELGNGDVTKALSLNFHATEDWIGEIEIDRNAAIELTYKYVLYTEQDGQYTQEWGGDRLLVLDPTKTDHFFCFDSWNAPGSLENVFLTTPFQEVLLKTEKNTEISNPTKKYTHIFKVKAPLLPKNKSLCLVGDCDALGKWSTNSPIILNRTDGNWWSTAIDLSKAKAEVHYKYGIYDPDDKRFLYFESGPDRIATIINSKKTIVQLSDGFVRIENNSWKGAGVSLPVFSIRTKKSLGVGDFTDIKLFVDWAEKVGLKLIQVLPLNDTTGTHTDADVLPYAAISAFALNPLFLNLQSMGKLPVSNPLQKEFETRQTEWN